MSIHHEITDEDEKLLAERTIIDVKEENPPDPGVAPSQMDGGTYGYRVTLSCGHKYWTPIPVTLNWPKQCCAQCVNLLVDRLRARRQ